MCEGRMMDLCRNWKWSGRRAHSPKEIFAHQVSEKERAIDRVIAPLWRSMRIEFF